MLTRHAASQGVPGHVYAHVLAHRIRSGRVSVDLSDGHLEPVKKTAGASDPDPDPDPKPNPNPYLTLILISTVAQTLNLTLALTCQDRRCAAHICAVVSSPSVPTLAYHGVRKPPVRFMSW